MDSTTLSVTCSMGSPKGEQLAGVILAFIARLAQPSGSDEPTSASNGFLRGCLQVFTESDKPLPISPLMNEYAAKQAWSTCNQ